ncbi:MAG: hypothetical protein ACK5Z5_09685 [Neisseriaceae bacterium]|jgi:hypothetical protein
MYYKRRILFICFVFIQYFKAYATNSLITKSTQLAHPKTESQVLQDYSGNIGTGINHKTVTATGGAVEFTPGGSNFFVFFSQTLSNDFYYEGRFYTRYNYVSQPPITNDVPISSINNPLGYGAVIKLGYDFHPTNLIDIIPYLRLNAYNNMVVVYSDLNGHSINSTAYAILPGIKIAYKVTPQFNPYVDLFGGWQQVNLSGELSTQTNSSLVSTNGSLNQKVISYEIGFSSKLTNSISLIPYMQYITTVNNPDSSAAASYTDNGFNINGLTNTQQVFGLKFSYAW